MDELLVRAVEQGQAPSGGFRSRARLPGGLVVPDCNALITALVLRELDGVVHEGLEPVRARAASYLLGCGSPRMPDTFGFWPEHEYPLWMQGARLHPDADDTAVVTVQLFDMGVLDRGALAAAASCLARHRAGPAHVTAPWQREGAFLTWLYLGRANTVDCCVNANAVALLARAGRRATDGYRRAVEMILAATSSLTSVGDRSAGVPADVSPYYPDPVELAIAVEWALRCGADELVDAADALSRAGVALPAGIDDDAPVCSSIDRRFSWSCSLLQQARRARWSRQAGVTPSPGLREG